MLQALDFQLKDLKKMEGVEI
jgi:hypothetical protein